MVLVERLGFLVGSINNEPELFRDCDELLHITPHVRLSPGFHTLRHSKFANSPDNGLFSLIDAQYGLQVVIPGVGGEEVVVGQGGFNLDIKNGVLFIAHSPQGISNDRQRLWLDIGQKDRVAIRRFQSKISTKKSREGDMPILQFRVEFMDALLIIAERLKALGITRIEGRVASTHAGVTTLASRLQAEPKLAKEFEHKQKMFIRSMDQLYEAYGFVREENESGKPYYFLNLV